MRFGRETLGEIQGRSSPAWMKRSMLQGLCVTQEESDRDLWLSDLHPSLSIGKDAARCYREAGEGLHTNSSISRGRLGLSTHAIGELRDADGII